MTVAATDQELSEDPRVIDAAREYLAELELGRLPNRNGYYVRYPELRDELEECFDGMEMAHAAGLVLRPVAPTPQPEILSAPLGDFQIVREIGRGGMGIVYEAVQISLNRRVALKVLPFAASLDAKQLQRFKTEAHAAAQLHHTNIVPVYAIGYERGMHFYAMQLIDGRSLDQVICELRGERSAASPNAPTIELRNGSTVSGTEPKSHGSFQRSGRKRENVRMAARIAAQVAEALDYAHDVGVVHRDIKPANLLIDGNGTIWIADFGLAQINADVKLTQTGDIFGTLRYMSPEQASGRRALVDHRTDVYSLGVTLYELLALEPLFAGDDRQTLLHQILNQEPRPLRNRDRSIPVDLETIVLKSLAKAPEDRYQSAGEMAADLNRFLNERTILARRPSIIDRTRKWMRRHPSIIAASIAMLIFMVVILGASTVLIAREKQLTEQAKQRAEEQYKLAKRAADDIIHVAEVESDNNLQAYLGFRKRLFEISIAYYKEFFELNKDDADAQKKLDETRARMQAVLDDFAALKGEYWVTLLAEMAILDDLQVTADQKKRLSDYLKRFLKERPGLIVKFKNLPLDQKHRQFLEYARKTDAEISKILTAEQKVRLGQLGHQCQGLLAFNDPYVLAELSLGGTQFASIEVIKSEWFAKNFQENAQIVRNGKQGITMKELEQENLKMAMKRVEALLSPEQLKKWKLLVGEPLKGAIPVNRNEWFNPFAQRVIPVEPKK
jgi:serine/threonine protein kinase